MKPENKKNQHTKGPWKVIGHKYVESTVGQLICGAIVLKGKSLKDDETNESIANANAHLIAAAPEMLEALEKWAQFMIDNYRVDEISWYNETLEAIAKARGES